jgi:putative SOS response-associated peptidase YedK
MCGRYSLTSSGADIWDLIDQSVPDSLKPPRNVIDVDFIRKRWQVAPNDWMPSILPTGYTKAHWWLLPSWTKTDEYKWRITGKGEKSFSWLPGKPKSSHFNSRIATLTDPGRRYWFKLLDQQRCLIPANGFVEWSDVEMLKSGEKKRQALFYLKLQKPFFFAGVFDFAKDNEGNDFPSVNIITTEPNEYLKSLPHHRMPAILHREDVKAWMDSRLGNAEARKLIKTVPKDEMEYHFLGPLINKASNDVPEALEPIAH